MPGITAAAALHRPPRASQDVSPTGSVVGWIKWLPPIESVPNAHRNLHRDCYDHPVLIMARLPSTAEAQIAIITSFNSTSLTEKFPRPGIARRVHLPIRPSAPHPDSGVLLEFTNSSLALDKESYVKAETIYTVKMSILKPFGRGRQFVLSKESMDIVREYCGKATTEGEIQHPPISSPVTPSVSVLTPPRLTTQETITQDERIATERPTHFACSASAQAERRGSPARTGAGTSEDSVARGFASAQYSVPGSYGTAPIRDTPAHLNPTRLYDPTSPLLSSIRVSRSPPLPYSARPAAPYHGYYRTASLYPPAGPRPEGPGFFKSLLRLVGRGVGATWTALKPHIPTIIYLATICGLVYGVCCVVNWIVMSIVRFGVASWEWVKDGTTAIWDTIRHWFVEKAHWASGRLSLDAFM